MYKNFQHKILVFALMMEYFEDNSLFVINYLEFRGNLKPFVVKYKWQYIKLSGPNFRFKFWYKT